MKESPLGFDYTWADLKPVRALFVTIIVAQFAGAALCVWLAVFASWSSNLWFGGAISTFPAFLPGLFVQSRLRPGSIRENRVMVVQMGFVAAILSGIAVYEATHRLQ